MSDHRKQEEARLIEKLAEEPHDEQAWRDLFNLEWAFVLAHCYRDLRGHRNLAREAAQEVFERLVQYQPFPDLRKAGAFRAYLSSTCHNVCMDYLRRMVSDRRLEEILVRDASMRESPASADERLEQKELLERVLGELTPDDSELVWHVAQGYTLEETARRLGMSASNARVRMHRIRKRLRDEFPEEADK